MCFGIFLHDVKNFILVSVPLLPFALISFGKIIMTKISKNYGLMFNLEQNSGVL